MACPFPQRTHLPQLFSITSAPSPTLSSSKLKRVIRTFILSHFLRISQNLIKAKTLIFQAVKNIDHVIHYIDFSMRKNKGKNKIFLGSFRLHYNFCSSHIRLEQAPGVEGLNFSDVPSADHTCDDGDDGDDDDDEIMADEEDAKLSGYLHWLEGKAGSSEADPSNEIDRLADMFIAESRMKFKVEKEESYRRFQDMLARSV